MDEEVASIDKMGTWSITPLPTRARPISCIKPGVNSHFVHCKSTISRLRIQTTTRHRLLGAFAKFKTIRLFITLGIHLGWPIEHMDVLTAFLNGLLGEVV